jgi:hypothetical protein
MVWCALLYAGTASWLSWLVGRPLIELNSERYAREVDLRFALMRLCVNNSAVGENTSCLGSITSISFRNTANGSKNFSSLIPIMTCSVPYLAPAPSLLRAC